MNCTILNMWWLDLCLVYLRASSATLHLFVVAPGIALSHWKRAEQWGKSWPSIGFVCTSLYPITPLLNSYFDRPRKVGVKSSIFPIYIFRWTLAVGASGLTSPGIFRGGKFDSYIFFWGTAAARHKRVREEKLSWVEFFLSSFSSVRVEPHLDQRI